MSGLDFAHAANSTATAIISAGTPVIAKALDRIGTYNEITGEAIAKNTTRNLKEVTDEPIVDRFGQIGLVKGAQIDIQV